LIAILVVALVGAIAALAILPGGSGAPVPGPATSTATPAASPAYPLDVKLGRVVGHGANGIVRSRFVRQAASALQRTFTDLYETAFVDPRRWDGGRFPGLDAFFAKSARADVHRHLGELSLGAAARRLDAVRPGTARLDVRFVTNRRAHPVVAFADMDFTATGLTGGGGDVRIAQRGRFVLQRDHGGWRIQAFDVRAKIPTAADVAAKARRARFAPGPASPKPLFILVIGSDARPGQPVTGTRGDSLHIVGVNPRLHRGSIVGIPRDSFVSIPGHGTSKINAALFYGGPELLVRTVEQLTGVHIDGYLVTGFAGFQRLITAIGGLDLTVPWPMNDTDSGAHFSPGPTHLNGAQALAFSRDRHDVPGGDLGRSKDQERVLLAALHRLRQVVARDPARLIPWLVAATRFIKTDLSLSQMTELLLAASTFEPGRIRSAVVFGSGDVVNGADVIRLGPSAFATFRDLRGDAVLGH
jgi:polyisoprenyl-teichoic acid--peptidoglycan teichoic acid transferase